MRKKSNPHPPAIATSDEIENFSLGDESLPVMQEAKAELDPESAEEEVAQGEPSAVPEPERQSVEPSAEGGEDVAAPRTRRSRKEEPLPSIQQKMRPEVERIFHIAAMILVPLVFIAVFWAFLMKSGGTGEVELKKSPTLPMVGNLLTIEESTTGWRDRNEKDRVSPERELITREMVFPNKLPVVKVKISPNVKNSFLRILFLNSEGKIAGDQRVVKMVDGKFVASGEGEQVTSNVECEVTASTGLQTERHFKDYLASSQKRWSVEISESSSYQAQGDEWKVLDTFAIADIRR